MDRSRSRADLSPQQNTEHQAALIEKAKQGEIRAFEEIVNMFSGKLNSIAYRFTGSSEDAREIVQDVFIKLYMSLKKYDPRFALSTWLYRITLNRSIDFLRRKGRVDRHGLDGVGLKSDSDPEKQYESRQKMDCIRACLPELSEHQRIVLMLRDFEDLKTEEIAAIFGNNPSTIRVHLARARLRLKELIKDRYPEFFE